jgi:hypothetical protein
MRERSARGERNTSPRAEPPTPRPQMRHTKGRFRGATRALQRWLGLVEEIPGEQQLIDELHRWVLGLPYVEEINPVPSAPDIRRFAVCCPFLGCASVLLLTGRFGTGEEVHDETVSAVLPQRMARALTGRGSVGPDLPGDRRLVAMKPPESPGGLVALEDVLLTAYVSVFYDGQ